MLDLMHRFAELEGLVTGDALPLSFLSPLTASGWAALARINRHPRSRLSGDAGSYADTVGLLDVAGGGAARRQPMPGNSYSPLVELISHAAVEPCNAVINNLIRSQLGDFPSLAGQACMVTGELHDNVPSHASGAGFSMAQYYPSSSELELCVADCGRGMLRNVKHLKPQIVSHGAAIAWCVEEGHTTAREQDEWAQHFPEDAMENPYGEAVETRHTDNHHVGLGLWKLAQISRATRGSLGIWSGDARWQIHNDSETLVAAPFWQGVVIALRLPVATAIYNEGQLLLGELEKLAHRLEL